MIFQTTKLRGVFIVEPQKLTDERGFFALEWSEKDFEAAGLEKKVVETNISFNKKKGILRGMHYQNAPLGQAKLVRCTRGAIFDVAIDLRPDSNTFKQWVGVELTSENYLQLYIPAGFAHGFQTLEDNTEVHYQMSQVYAPEYASGVRWDDPAFAIVWPPDERTILPRDRSYPDFTL